MDPLMKPPVRPIPKPGKPGFLRRILCAIALLTIASKAHALSLKVFVSPEGNDRWSGLREKAEPGRSDGPVATLARARDIVRSHRGQRAEVVIAGGDYYLSDGLVLSSDDSGTKESPVIYRAADGQEPHLIGGRRVDQFVPVQHPQVLSRFKPEARNHILQANLREQGIQDFGQYHSRGFGRPGAPAALELFFQDRPMTVARWPNDGFTKITGFPKDQQTPDEHGGTLGNLAGGFFYESDEPARWKKDDNLWVHGYWAYDWANSYERVASIDVARRLVKTAKPYGIYGFRKGQRVYFLNVLEELDSPGEWYLDAATGILYFWPPAPPAPGSVRVSLVEQPLIQLRNVSNVTFRGLTIECTRGDGIRIEAGDSDAIDHCTIRNVGDTAVVVEGGVNHRVAGCEIYNPGDGGISLTGGNRKTLAPANHVAENNVLHDLARWSKCYQPAIGIEGVGIRAAHNLIYNHPHCAILLGGNEHVIEFNEIHHVCLETGDVGAIYMGRDYTFRGNVIRNNFIHDTGGVGMGSMGVYMDDCVSGTVIDGNLFKNVQRAVFLGGGRDFRVENNVFVDCRPAVQLDARGLDRTPVWHDMVYTYMRQRLQEMNPDQPPYSSSYPELADLKKYFATDTGVPPGNITIAHNISVGGKWLSLQWHATKAMVHAEQNLVDTDPHFVDAAAANYQLRDDSPALALGFKRLPIEQIGPNK